MNPTRQTLRVALDTSFAGLNTTGVGIYSRRLAEQLCRVAESKQMRVRCYGPCQPGDAGGRVLGGLYYEWPTYTQLALPLLLSKYSPGVVHSTSHLGPTWGPGRRVVTVHDLIFRRYPEDYNKVWLAITRILLPRVLAGASAIIADSETTRADLARFYRVRPERVTVIYPGVDDAYRRIMPLSTICTVKKEHDIEGERYILCMGPWVRRKNLGVVVEAFKLLAEEVPDVLLVITGEPATGMQGDKVPALLEELPPPIRRSVRTVGHLSDEHLLAMMQGASVLAYPSRFEGFGLPPVEAMAAGVPVVASDTGAVVEASGSAALYAPVDKPAQWAAALSAVLTDPARAEQMRQIGRQQSAKFTWQGCTEQILDLYDRICGRE